MSTTMSDDQRREACERQINMWISDARRGHQGTIFVREETPNGIEYFISFPFRFPQEEGGTWRMWTPEGKLVDVEQHQLLTPMMLAFELSQSHPLHLGGRMNFICNGKKLEGLVLRCNPTTGAAAVRVQFDRLLSALITVPQDQQIRH